MTGPSPHPANVLTEATTRFALDVHLRPGPGGFIDATPDRVVEFRPSWPMAGPNGVRRLTCTLDRVAVVVEEVRALARGHGVGLVWALNEDYLHLEPELIRLGITPTEEMVILAVEPEAAIAIHPGADVVMRDGLASFANYVIHQSTVDAAFRGGVGSAVLGDLEARYEQTRTVPDVWLLTAYVDDRPAGGGGLQLWPDGALLGAGAVLPDFRRRGVYRSLVAARCQMAERNGALPIATSARPTSRPILESLGFRRVGGYRSYSDRRVDSP